MLTDWEFERPTNYGWFHLLWWLILIITIIILYFVVKKKGPDEKRDHIFVLSFGVMLVLIEIYKQIFFTKSAGYYQWYAFPFQFCSAPMYAALIGGIVPSKKIREAIYSFLSFYGLVGGLCVMFYPGDVFTRIITICIHTMLWHSSMVAIGFYLILSRGYGKKLTSAFKELFPGFITFVGFVVVALFLNFVFHYNGIESVNLFFISPFNTSTLPFFSTFQPKVPYPIFLLTYVFAFALGSSTVFFLSLGIRKLKSCTIKKA